MTEDEMKNALQTTDKYKIAEYLFERTVIDLALEARDIINKILTKQYELVDAAKLRHIVSSIEKFTDGSDKTKLPHHMPVFILEAFTKFADKFGPGEEQLLREPHVKD